MEAVKTGVLGENFAVQMYTKNGYIILKRNYRSRFGEIDIIAENGSYLVFVEVKTRSAGCIAQAREAVNAAKQERLILTAMQYLTQSQTEKQPRFDVVEVMQSKGRVYKYDLIENAF